MLLGSSSIFASHPTSRLVNISARPSGLRRAPTRVGQPSLFEFVILSMLLHLLVIVLFGNPSGGSVRRNESWGSLDVILGRPTAEPGAGFRLAPGADTPSPGSSLLPRTGAAPQPAGAGTEAPERAAQPPESKTESAQRPNETPEVATPPEEVLPSAPSPRHEAPSSPDLKAPQERDRNLTPSSPLQRLTPPKFEGRLASPAELAPRELPMAPTVPLERIAPPRVDRQLAPPVELAPREIPLAPAAPIERIAVPRTQPQIAAPAELLPREQPTPAAPIERIAPATADRPLAPPVELERQLPAAPSAPMERLPPPIAAPSDQLGPPAELHAPVRPQGSAAPAEAAQPKPELEGSPAATPTPRGETAPQLERGVPVRPEPERAPAAPAAPAPERFHFGSPTPEEEIFKPRGNVMPPVDEASSPPYIDLEGARREVARQVLREGAGSRAILALPVPPPPEYKSKEARAIEKASKPDCRTEYAALGLFAVPALLISALADTGCRW